MASRLSTLRLERLDRAQWAAALEGLSAYPFFVTPRFIDAWARHLCPGARARAYRLHGEEDGWRLVAGASMRTSRVRTRTWIAAPEGGYGCAGSGSMPATWPEELLQLLGGPLTDRIELVLGPDEPAADPLAEGISIERLDAWILDLRDGAQAWESRLDKRVRRQLRVCEDAGLTTRRHGLDGLDEFWSLYRQSLADNPARHVTYPRAFIADLLRDEGPGAAAIYLTRRHGTALAGGLLLEGGTEALAWIGCFDRRHAGLHANLHRHATVIRDLAASGVSAYNLGAAPGLPAVAEFKRKLGAVASTYRDLRWRNARLERLRAILGR